MSGQTEGQLQGRGTVREIVVDEGRVRGLVLGAAWLVSRCLAEDDPFRLVTAGPRPYG
ncbi:hypothetical protein ACFXPX_20185 [Kitasatospora sp. NPDC059146]|uniref:hypothetical protein n=1 Tax=unclassified Kitasatospora TaxID=2633591 RepID=UPI0036B8E6B3